ncbi:MAG: cadherin-like beta sandwich domain-containing protein [Clostridiales bacterium]|nr:cadherin-like beta sandwich domain-containing protein [Clostridiales bacterium]
MKRIISLAMVLALLCACMPVLADDGEAVNPYSMGPGSTLLVSLTHNCTHTGIMLPEVFSPYQTTYLLTVGYNVTRPRFTPTAADPNAVITVNGQVVRSGQDSNYLTLPEDNKPQVAQIVVTNGSASTTYTIFMQRRPDERRTRVSAGYINNIYLDGNTWMIDADLVSIKYSGEDYTSGNLSTFSNSSVDHYRYAVNPNCILYYGTKQDCHRSVNLVDFMNNYQNYGSNLYTIVYIRDQIVAVVPYGADY